MRRLSKGWRIFILAVIILALGTGGVYALSPQIECMKFRLAYYDRAEWLQYASRTDADSWLYHPVNYTGLDTSYVPTEKNLAFSSNRAVRLGRGYTLTGLYGVSDWMMWVGVYGRNDLQGLSLQAQGSENSAYPEKRSPERTASGALFGQTILLPLAAPETVENGQITLDVTLPDGSRITQTLSVDAAPLALAKN